MTTATKSLRRRAAAVTLGKTKGAATLPAPKGTTKNQGTPLGDFADFLRWRLAKHFRGDRKALADALKDNGVKAGEETVRKWEQGTNGPKLHALNGVARALGYSDWFELVAAVRKFKAK